MHYLLKWIKFSVKKQNIKKILENGKKYWKSQGKVGEFCHSGKVGTLGWDTINKPAVRILLECILVVRKIALV